MRIRKNINCLTANELHDLREAFAGIYQLADINPESFTIIAGLHGNPAPSYCIHGNNGFLTWHRAYLLELENALRTIRCDVVLPFWNWSSGNTTGLPAACSNPTYVNRNGDTVPNPLYSGPIPASSGGGQTSRRPDINTTTFGDLAALAQNAMTQTVWSDFVSDLNSVHGDVHVRIGGNMGSVPTAAFDPIFWFHHANVDRLWAYWQALNPMPLPASEANAVLDPFTQPYTNSWHLGADFANTLDWDYRYQNWCFFFPPILVPPFRIIEIPIDDWLFGSRRIALALNSPMMPMHSFQLRVFVNSPKANAKTKIEDNPNYAGSIGVFGMGAARMHPRKNQEFKLTLDLTQMLRKCIRKSDKTLSLNLVPVYGDAHMKMEKGMEGLQVNLEVF